MARNRELLACDGGPTLTELDVGDEMPSPDEHLRQVVMARLNNADLDSSAIARILRMSRPQLTAA